MKNKVIINLDAPGSTISRHIYGHFAEHLGRCIYDGFYVGPDSPIPNKNGIRLDIVEAFKKLGIPNLRWPGGCFADEYHWEDGIGPKETRPEMINTHWGGVVENNHFGTHEFMELCDLLGTEPYITGNVGSGSVREMSQWVEYMTFDGKSPMSELRKKNGREQPWKIKYWGVGNENWGCGGGMKADFYADQARRYSTYCRNYGDNELYKIICGPNSDDYHWMEVMMQKLVACPSGLPEDRFCKGISLHYYTINGDWDNKGHALDSDIGLWKELMLNSWKSNTLLERHKTIMDHYDPHKKIGLIFDEWGIWHKVEKDTNPGFLYQQNTIRDALSASLHFDIFHKHSDRLHMANLAQAVNVLQAPLLTKDDQLVLTPTYHVMEMNKNHMDATNLPIFYDETEHQDSYKDQKYSDFSLSASRKKDQYLVSMTNLNPEKNKDITLDLRGDQVRNISGRILHGEKLNSHNSFESPSVVTPQEFSDYSREGSLLNIKLPARSFITLSINE
ncbi:alpha-N-arabinofuranosidase [Spirochaeta cellobiosiphila]|uniref:alpha-N-arabinofuranosidase n=1 Tax=Spirochaeta cellobiosiphila TaxID=504483 RepID=UPI000406B391|nr:alpha-L-arabinofuranosidase C-terminal domain-containing protein [Spirochaeta cellobiosiphila]